VAARGLDVPQLRLVVNFDVPNHLEDYVHRVGRTGRAGNKGTAWTFITPEEEKYAKDLMIALKSSNQPIPEELSKLHESFQEKRSKGLVSKRKSGFVGQTGFQFDETEALQKHQEMKLLRMAHGVLADDDDEDELEKIQQQLILQKTAQKLEKAGAAAGTLPTNPASVADTKAMIEAVGAGQTIQAEVLKQLEGTNDAVPIAQSAEEARLRAKLMVYGWVSKGPAGGSLRYSDELEINDYPQQAKRKVTQHDSLAPIMEFTGCGVTSKGHYFAPGAVVPPGERKLYLLIDGPSIDAVRSAKNELKRIMDEACAAHPTNAIQPGGRYQV